MERTIRSVLEQSYRDIELIIVDDGSTDNSFTVAERVVASVPDRHEQIKLLRQENGGPSAARNTGSRNAQGEWILFLDADDELLPGALETLAGAADRHTDADIVEGVQIVEIGEKLRTPKNKFTGYSKNTFRDWFYDRIAPSTNHSIFRRTLIEKIPYNVKLRRYEDVDWLFRILRGTVVYSIDIPISLVHCAYATASYPRKDINEDFLGHLDFKGRSFWERMCMYKFYLYEREHYKEECRRLYPMLHCRYDLLLIYKLLMWIDLNKELNDDKIYIFATCV